MTSANQSGEAVCTSLDEIEVSCPTLDGMMEGSVSFGEASTIIDCTSEEVKILRQGPVTMEQIQKALQ
jgi:L-threonylcarbamoyladenylate synthase